MSPTLQAPEECFSFEEDEEGMKTEASLPSLEEVKNKICDTEAKQNIESEKSKGVKRKLETGSEKSPENTKPKRQREKKFKCTYPNCSAVFGRPDRLQTHIDANHAHIVRILLKVFILLKPLTLFSAPIPVH